MTLLLSNKEFYNTTVSSCLETNKYSTLDTKIKYRCPMHSQVCRGFCILGYSYKILLRCVLFGLRDLYQMQNHDGLEEGNVP